MASKHLCSLYKRSPVNFGPFPGPRQSLEGKKRDGSNTVSIEAFITFKTDQAALQPLLPEYFAFQKPGIDAFVTIAPKELLHLDWLGDRGYSLYSIFIHDVRYTAPSGRVYDATYLPVLWENFADPIVSGREELGFPKIYADLVIKRTETTYSVEASWKGTVFSRFDLGNLRETTHNTLIATAESMLPSGGRRDPNLLLHRYIPAVGRPGEADADYPVYVSAEAEAKTQKVTTLRSFVADSCDASVSWICSAPSDLPTLHHIIGRLATIPVREIVSCGVTEKKGGADLSTALRVDGKERSSKL